MYTPQKKIHQRHTAESIFNIVYCKNANESQIPNHTHILKWPKCKPTNITECRLPKKTANDWFKDCKAAHPL